MRRPGRKSRVRLGHCADSSSTARLVQRAGDDVSEAGVDGAERARTLGIESGVAGALSVIPQILISMIVKTPAFVLAIIRESTLSVVQCVRILASDDANKLDSVPKLAGHRIGVLISGGNVDGETFTLEKPPERLLHCTIILDHQNPIRAGRNPLDICF